MNIKIIFFCLFIALVGGSYYSIKKNPYVRSKTNKIERQVKDFLHTPAINKYDPDTAKIVNALPEIVRSRSKIKLPEQPNVDYLKTLPYLKEVTDRKLFSQVYDVEELLHFDDYRRLKVGSVATGLGLLTLPFGGWIPAVIAGGVGLMVGNKQFPAGEKPWRDIDELLNEGEHGRLEFKSNLSGKKKPPFDGIVRTLIAFANADGGELIIGVTDSGKINGLNEILEKYKNLDKFESSIRDAIRNNTDGNTNTLYRLKFEEYDDQDICRIEINKSRRQIFHQDGSFLIRDGNISKSLNPKDYKLLNSDDD